MRGYPPHLKEAAKNLLDNEDFTMLIQYRASELQTDVLDSIEQTEVLNAHQEYNHLKGFGEWIKMLGEPQFNARTDK